MPHRSVAPGGLSTGGGAVLRTARGGMPHFASVERAATLDVRSSERRRKGPGGPTGLQNRLVPPGGGRKVRLLPFSAIRRSDTHLRAIHEAGERAHGRVIQRLSCPIVVPNHPRVDPAACWSATHFLPLT